VVEAGGVLSHGAITAREPGMHTAVNVCGAMSKLLMDRC
jgi:hypothetical protein